MSGLGSLVLSMAVDTAEFSSDLGKAAHEAEKRMKDIGDAAEKAANLLSASFIAAAGTLVYFTKQEINAADQMLKMSQGAGVSVRAFSELAYAADLAGVNNEAFSASLSKLSRNIAEAAAGGGAAKQAFEDMGINIRRADGSLKSADEVLEDIAANFHRFRDGAEKSALASDTLGKTGTTLIPFLNQGRDGIRQMREEAVKLGISLDPELAKKSEQLNDNLSKLAHTKRGVALSIASELLPQINDLIESVAKATGEVGQYSKITDGARIVFEAIAITGANVAYVFKQMGNEIGGIAAQMMAFASLDLESFEVIGEEMRRDAKIAREELDAFERKIQTTTQIAAMGYYDLGQKMKELPPIVKDTKAAEEAEKKRAAALKASTEAAAELAKKIQEIYVEQEKQDEDAVKRFEEAEKTRREKAKSGLEQVRESLMDEREQTDQWNLKSLEALRLAREEELLTDELYQGLKSSQLEAYHSKVLQMDKAAWTEREKFARMSMKDQAKTIFGELANITAGVSQHNRALFEINKVAGIANAIINAYEGISLTMSKYPYPLNIAMAAAHGLAAFAQVQAISKTQFGSGATAPSLAGGTAATPVTPVTSGTPGQGGGGQTTVIQLSGREMYSDKEVRGLLKRLQESTDKGGRIQFA